MFEQPEATTSASSGGKTSPASSATKAMRSAAFSVPWWANPQRYSRQGEDGRTLVVCMDPKEQRHGGCWMPNISAWPNDAAVCSLSQVLEEGSIPQRYFLSPKACAGILRRAEARGKTLPDQLLRALVAVAERQTAEARPASSSQSPAWHTDRGAEIAEGRSPTLTCNHEAPIVVHGTQDPDVRRDQAHTLGRNNGAENAVLAFAENSRSEVRIEAGDGQIVGTLSTGGGKPGQGRPCVAVCVTGDITHTLKADGFDGSEDGTGRGQPIVTHAIQAGALRINPASGPDGVGVQADHAYTLEARSEVQAVQSASAVRRLTPRECERLQGFPDDWTLIPYRKKPAEQCPDGPRYKAIGNSKAVFCVRWIARRIDNHIQRLNP
ncbi:hypothetical protein CNQ84_00755 [Pseudomonas abyssi]|uniref:Uncharacterized protein n=1 Tax=Pseudomonas abyssi TaxID=170540 RepID=A0A2A3MNC4_9PSED|nr:hypothetical protein CNQ84_00755 [Pseudomonas abyssi]